MEGAPTPNPAWVQNPEVSAHLQRQTLTKRPCSCPHVLRLEHGICSLKWWRCCKNCSLGSLHLAWNIFHMLWRYLWPLRFRLIHFSFVVTWEELACSTWMCQTDVLGLTQGEVLRLWDISFCQRQLNQRCSVLLSFGFDFFFFVTTVLSGKMSFWWNRNCWRNLTNFDNSAWKGAGEEYLESAGAPSYDIFWMERSFDLFLFLFSKWCFKMFCFVGEQNGWIKCLKKKKEIKYFDWSEAVFQHFILQLCWFFGQHGMI